MTKYTINENDILQISKEINIYKNRFSLIMSLIFIFMWLIMFVVGLIIKQSNLVYLSLGCFCLEILYLIMLYFSLKRTLKQVQTAFLELYPSGEQIIELTCKDNQIYMHDVILNTNTKISKDNIKKSTLLKSIILFKLVDKTYIYFYRNDSVLKELGM